ncbi:MAG: acyltransferase family protein [Syntrophales bacterium]
MAERSGNPGMREGGDRSIAAGLRSLCAMPPYPEGNRDRLIDAMKGVGILLVVFGHAVLAHDPRFRDNPLFIFVFSFTMPLFFFLSGWVLPRSLDRPAATYLGRQFRRLVVPFLAWHAVYFAVRGGYTSGSIAGSYLELLHAPAIGLWFLWALFLASGILFLAIRGMRSAGWEKWEDAAVILVVFAVRLIRTDWLAVPEVQHHLIFYAAGFLVSKYRSALSPSWNRLPIAAAILFPLLAPFWRQNELPRFYPWLVEFLGASGPARLAASVYKDLVAFSGIGMVAFVLQSEARSRIQAALCRLGTLTLDIYVSHALFLTGFGREWTLYLSSAGAGLIMSLALSLFLLRRIKPLRVVFLGLDR